MIQEYVRNSQHKRSSGEDGERTMRGQCTRTINKEARLKQLYKEKKMIQKLIDELEKEQ